MYGRLVFALTFALVLTNYQSEGSAPDCEKKERSLAGLDLAKDSLSKAKDLYPNCTDIDETTNSSECGLKDKSLGYIEVALNLISEARKDFPVCPSPKIEKFQLRPMDCSDVLGSGQNTSGIYRIWPRSRVFGGRSLDVLCDMKTDGGGWTVIQRRGNFSEQENFDRDWNDYKNGFGNISRDFWIGNENIYSLSNQGVYSVRFDMKDVAGSSGFDVFRDFWIEDEKANYTLHIGEHFLGNAGDSMTYHSGSMFSTKDRKNDKHATSCAQLRKSGFWFYKCSYCNPNGLYRPGAKEDTANMYYSSWRSLDGLFSMEIKLKRL